MRNIYDQGHILASPGMYRRSVLLGCVLLWLFIGVGCDGIFGDLDSVEPPHSGEMDAGTDADAGTEFDADVAVASDADLDAGTDADAGSELDAGTDADVGTELDAGTDADVAVEPDADVGTELDAGTDADAGAEPDATSECSGDEIFCDGGCVDPLSNSEHCNGCGNKCGDDKYCDDGVCELSCDNGLIACDQKCVDTEEDPEHCGGCGELCTTDVDGAVAQCQGGQCDVTCGGESIEDNDPNHCGSCGNECAADLVCANGNCVEPCDDDGEPFGGGDGTEADPYRICTVDHLLSVANNMQDFFVLRSDLDLSSVGPINMLGDGISDGFEGSFNGDGFTIEALSVNESKDRVGLFSHIRTSGRIFDLTLTDVDITGDAQVGALAGSSAGELSAIIVDGGTVRGKHMVGGLVGSSQGEVIDSSTDVSVEIDADSEDIQPGATEGEYGGGLVGYNDGIIVQSRALGDVGGNARVVGGLVGLLISGVVERSYAAGAVEAVEVAGGLAGSTVNYEFGADDAEIIDSYATGDVSAADRVGGLAGLILLGSSVSNTYAIGAVAGDEPLGGLIGRHDDDRVEASYWNVDIVDTGVGGGDDEGIEGLETSDFGDSTNFDGWDFDDVWTIDTDSDGNQRPFLQW